MEKKYLLDSNIVIDYLYDQIPSYRIEEMENIFQNSFQMSIVSEIEILGWKKILTDRKISIEEVEEILGTAKIFEVNQKIKQKAIELKQIYQTPTVDAIIAATAIIYELTLVSKNMKDFIRIEELSFFSPY
ncbi:MAG: PIN domain-containing protein [Bacteroidetes bacterium]|nr:MAG: PIN domain-containing protein [Bacteroidota bacterium]